MTSINLVLISLTIQGWCAVALHLQPSPGKQTRAAVAHGPGPNVLKQQVPATAGTNKTGPKCLFHRHFADAMQCKDFGLEFCGLSELCNFDDWGDALYHGCLTNETEKMVAQSVVSSAGLPKCDQREMVRHACYPAGENHTHTHGIEQCAGYGFSDRAPFPERGECCNGEFDNSCEARTCNCDSNSLPVKAVTSRHDGVLTSRDAREALKNKTIWFLGDSTTRRMFYAFCEFLGDQHFWDRHGASWSNTACPEHGFLDGLVGDAGIALHFVWAPTILTLDAALRDPKLDAASTVITSIYHWDYRQHHTAPITFAESLVSVVQRRAERGVVFVGPNLFAGTEAKEANQDVLDVARHMHSIASTSKIRLAVITNEWMQSESDSLIRHPCLGDTHGRIHMRYESGQFIRVQRVLPAILAQL